MQFFPASSSWRRALALACLAALLSGAHAQDLPDAVQLGMTPQQLRQAVPGLQPVHRPVRLAGGLAGSWTSPPAALAGVAMAPTYFFADGELRRIEYVAPPDADAQAWNALLAWGRKAWGPELASQAPEGAYATWNSDRMEVYLQRTGDARRPQLRLVIKAVEGKDASEL
jgi:hypothetical protein